MEELIGSTYFFLTTLQNVKSFMKVFEVPEKTSWTGFQTHFLDIVNSFIKVRIMG